VAEFNQLNKMAQENLNLKLRDGQVRKRRRISGSDMTRKDADDDSSMSGWSGISQTINNERVMSPSTNLQKSTKNDQRYVPPMMFDQGTMTDTRYTGNSGGVQDKIQELQKLIELNEHMLNEQKLMKNEGKMCRLLVESFSDEFSAMRKSMQMIETKIETLITDRGQFDAIPAEQPKKKILNGSGSTPYFIIETEGGHASENASLSLNGSNLEYTVEELEADDSGRSTSRMSYHDQTSMMSNSSMDFMSGKKEPFRRSHSSSNFSVNSASSTPIARANSNSNLIEEWADTEGEIMIGSNKTTVPVHVLRAIDWKNYKTATRKLLITLFTRETLATRSLTGRPSPAFHDRNKPVKGKLDQNIINDIIQIVTRKCSVQESQVRTAITTKCADENKMLRNRRDNEEKEKFKTPSTAAGTKTENNKENVVAN
jgi:BEN domain